MESSCPDRNTNIGQLIIPSFFNLILSDLIVQKTIDN